MLELVGSVSTMLHCVAEGTLVTLADGTSIPIEDVRSGDDVLSYYAALVPGEKEGLIARRVDAVLDRGHRACGELLFSDGRTLVCTPDHRIRTADGRWVAAGDLDVGTAEVAVGVDYPNVTDGAEGAGERRSELTFDLNMAERVLPLCPLRLVERREVGVRHVFDLSVPSPQGEDARSFVANGIVAHNCQMMRDLEASERAKKMLPFFCEEQYTGKVVKEIPAVKSISHFLKQVFEVGQFHPECCVISLVYINRLIGVTGVPLTQSNWKPVAISALVLAQKVWDDTPLINADFSILYPALTVKEINFLERKFLDLLEFKLAVSPSLYAQYYFELRSICEENANAAAQAAGTAGVRGGMGGLSKSVLKRVELRSHLSEEYQKDKHAYKRRSMTIEDIGAKQNKVILS